MSLYVIGLDIGTGSTKGVLLDKAARVVASASHNYPVSSPKAGHAEQDPELWVNATVRVVRQLLSDTGIVNTEVGAISLSGQMHGLVCLDESGAVIRPAILWCDLRTTQQCEWIHEAVGGWAKLIRHTGNPALEGFTLPKMIWMRDNEKKNWARTKKILLPKDYVNYRLTGQLAMEYSDAAGSLMLDVVRKNWSKAVLEASGISPDLLPPVGESLAVVGHITSAVARETGLAVGTPVVAGGADNACAAIGIGAIEEGILAVSLGTSGTVIAPTSKPTRDKKGRVHTFNHAAPDTWYVMGVMQAAGLSLSWLAEQLEPGKKDGVDKLLAAASTVKAGSNGLLWLPYLNGERTPHLDAQARGAFIGLTAGHTRAHMARAVLEGVAYGLRDSLEIIRSMMISVDQIRLTGGGARNELWQHILADVFQEAVCTLNVEEGPAYGAGLLAGMGVGFWPDLQAAANQHVRVLKKIKPGRRSEFIYQQYYKVYESLYPALKPAFHSLHDLTVS